LRHPPTRHTLVSSQGADIAYQDAPSARNESEPKKESLPQTVMAQTTRFFIYLFFGAQKNEGALRLLGIPWGLEYFFFGMIGHFFLLTPKADFVRTGY